MIQGEATLGVPVMTQEVLAVVHTDIGQEAGAIVDEA